LGQLVPAHEPFESLVGGGQEEKAFDHFSYLGIDWHTRCDGAEYASDQQAMLLPRDAHIRM
jgi:hypothetical protein